MTGGYYDSTDREMRTRVLQRMLGALADPGVQENGRYDEATREAVRQFQRMRGYPATGVADRRTWEEMSRLYREREMDSVIEGIRPFVGRQRRIYPRERSDLVMILQLILNELRLRYDGFGPIPLSGIDGGRGAAVSADQSSADGRRDRRSDVEPYGASV